MEREESKKKRLPNYKIEKNKNKINIFNYNFISLPLFLFVTKVSKNVW
jgi:hypothetical protein